MNKRQQFRLRKHLIAGALSFGTVGALAIGLVGMSTPATAQIAVFDPNNYSQNILTAARTLQQVNNQIQSLQNEATMLLNQAKNLSHIDFPEMQALTQTMQQVNRLMGQAQGIRLQASGLDQQFRQLFPQSFGQALRLDQQVAAARTRLDTAVSAYEHTMTVQAQIAENVQADAQNLATIVAKSQGAEGSLQAQQATNQLLALTAKQQFQIQSMMAAQYRAETIEQARRAQEETDARAAGKRFLGSGTAYTPH